MQNTAPITANNPMLVSLANSLVNAGFDQNDVNAFIDGVKNIGGVLQLINDSCTLKSEINDLTSYPVERTPDWFNKFRTNS